MDFTKIPIGSTIKWLVSENNYEFYLVTEYGVSCLVGKIIQSYSPCRIGMLGYFSNMMLKSERANIKKPKCSFCSS